MRFPLLLLSLLTFVLPQISTAEILSPTDKIVEKFMELDADESESITFDEYQILVMDRLGNRFIEMDTNGDEQVTAEEYRNFWVDKKSQHYRPRR